jgi:N4-gp56 family major capsid protein
MADTTTTLSNEMMTFLSSDFLERSQALNVHREGFKKIKHAQNSGKTVTWNRYTPLTAATTAITEATTPTALSVTSATVSATVAEYGRHLQVSSLLYGTSIDRAAQEKEELMAQHAAETLDTLGRDELFSGATVQFAGTGNAALADIAAADTMNVTETRKAVRTLKKNNALAFDDGYFLGKVGPDTAFDLMADTTWVNAHTYKDGKELYKGELGKIHRVRFLECSSNQKHETSTVEVYSNFIHGKEAVGEVDLSGGNLRLIIKQSGKQDTSNPLDLYMTIGWKAIDAVKTLNTNWVINVKSAVSA